MSVELQLAKQFDYLCENLGEWNGLFSRYDSRMAVISQSWSKLELSQAENKDSLDFRLRLWNVEKTTTTDDPDRDIRRQWDSFDRDLIYFPGGAFCASTVEIKKEETSQVEVSFIKNDKRHRHVFWFDQDQGFYRRTLIREVKGNELILNNEVLNTTPMLGRWRGSQTVVTDQSWPHSTMSEIEMEIDPHLLKSLILFPDGGAAKLPSTVDLDRAFEIESFWMCNPQSLQRCLVTYSAGGLWQSTSFTAMEKLSSARH